ncbi:MAG: anti-sigma factor [Acidimicrobiia bacterium]
MSDLHSLAALYALDALDDDLDRARFEAHLAECAECRREVGEFSDVAAELAGAVAETPPPALRTAVLSSIDEVRQDRRVTTRSQRPRWIIEAVAIAAALLLVAVVSFQVGRSNGGASSDDVASVLLAGDAREQILAAPDGVRARVVTSPANGKAVFIAHGLPSPGEGKTYELWLITDEGPSPAGLFGSSDGAATVLTELVPGADAIGVTIEPSGGSATPSAPILISGSLT